MLFNKAYLLFFEGNYLESEILVSKALQLLKKNHDKNLNKKKHKNLNKKRDKRIKEQRDKGTKE